MRHQTHATSSSASRQCRRRALDPTRIDIAKVSQILDEGCQGAGVRRQDGTSSTVWDPIWICTGDEPHNHGSSDRCDILMAGRRRENRSRLDPPTVPVDGKVHQQQVRTEHKKYTRPPRWESGEHANERNETMKPPLVAKQYDYHDYGNNQ